MNILSLEEEKNEPKDFRLYMDSLNSSTIYFFSDSRQKTALLLIVNVPFL